MNPTPPLASFQSCDLRRSVPRVRYLPLAFKRYPLPQAGGPLPLFEALLLSIAEGALHVAAEDSFLEAGGR